MLSLYDAVIPSFKQTIGAIRGLLAKGRAYCEEQDTDLEALADTRLHVTMQPFRFQVRAGIHFSIGSLAALRTGGLSVPNDPKTYTYAELERSVDEALSQLDLVTRGDVDD